MGPNEIQSTLPMGRVPTLPIQGYTLCVLDGVDRDMMYVAKGERSVIGTDDAVDFKLTDKAISRFHCELTADTATGTITIRDLGSLNGLFVDGVRVIRAHLHPGAVLGIGQSRVKFELAAEPMHLSLSSKDRFGVMVGRSIPMRRAFSLLERAAQSNATVLLGGETGTGKEAAAESIHLESTRSEGPFLVVDCGAIPANLLESELFGHEKGAFTGADRARTGVFEEANGGTLFLDEIGELPPELQPKLLRALEKKEIKRVGSSKYMPVDVRIVAATNRNLRADVNAKAFRSDLYFRLAVVEVALPALRERTEDIPLLIESLLERLGLASSPDASLVRSPEFRAALERHAWPGNVRELRNYVERCLALAEQAPLESGDEPAKVEGTPVVDTALPLKDARDRWVATFEKAYLEKIMAEHNGNVTAAARAAGVARVHFYRLLWRSGLK